MAEVVLAPLCGVTDHVFRSICSGLGCEKTFTEMISAMGYLCAPNQAAVRQLMIRDPQEPHLVLQLFGRDPDTVAEAARRIESLGIYDGIDLNMGCPARKVASSGEGAGLMRTPEIACEMMKKTVRAVALPVSIKMRLGWDRDHINVIEMARMAEDAGIASIAVHGRTKEQQYSGEADWEMIARVKQHVRIPVIGNGDIFSGEDAVRRIRESGVDGVMIGRGVLGNPWIFRAIRQRLNGETETPVSLSERREGIRLHYRRMLETRPEHIAVREMRKHIGWYIHGLRGASATRVRINRCADPSQALDILDEFFGALSE